MTQYLISDTTLTNIANAIRTKKGTSALIDPADMATEIASISGGGGTINNLNVTSNGTYTASGGVDGYSPVVVNVPDKEVKDVNLYDYDGKILYSYTKTEFLNLLLMPTNPQAYSSLTNSGWNWSLSDAKTYVNKYGKLNIGAEYDYTGDTEIDITLTDGRLSPYLSIAVNGTATVDWGDGNTEAITGSNLTTYIRTLHEYAQAGDYTITITGDGIGIGTSREHILMGKSSGDYSENSVDAPYLNAVKAIRIGDNVTTINDSAFYFLRNLEEVLMSSYVTSIGNNAFRNCDSLKTVVLSSNTSIGSYAFFECMSLGYITIPNGITSIGDSSINGCRSMKTLSIPDSVTTIGNACFRGDYSLEYIQFPEGVTTINQYMFRDDYALKEFVICDTVTSLKHDIFEGCRSLKEMIIPSSVTEMISDTFYEDYALEKVTIAGTPSIGSNIFYGCTVLRDVSIPDGTTSIGSSCFRGCRSLSSITIPDTVATINNEVFRDCTGLGAIYFEGTTPPTVTNSNAFSSLTTDCIIYVPTGTLADYTSATNYPSSSTYTYQEY